SQGPGDERGTSKKEATLLLWLFMFAFGGGGLARYYSRIGYFPEIDWHQALSYLAALGITGGWIILVFGVLLFVPGYIWCEFLIFDPAIQSLLCFVKGGRPEPCVLTSGRYVTGPFLIIIILWHGILLMSTRDVRPGSIDGPLGAHPWLAIAGIMPLLVAASVHMWRGLHKHLERSGLSDIDQKSKLTKYVFSFNVSVLLGLFGLAVISWILRAEDDLWLMALCSLVVVASNLLVAMQFRVGITRAMFTTAIAATILLVAGEINPGQRLTLVDRVMEGYGFTRQKTSTLVLAEEACKFLQGLIKVEPLNEKFCAVSKVAILSRLGVDFFVDVQGQRISIPKDLVESWSVPSLTSAPETPGTRSSAPSLLTGR
ncbi:MAG TPA: hypothetical protein VKU44_11420, partial [Terriglobia bacterium]|nr:hypothetical protein [Terriglobia bacterium]